MSTMVLHPQHAVVSFHANWSIKSWHCVVCGDVYDSKKILIQHLEKHAIQDLSATVVITGISDDQQFLNYTSVFTCDKSVAENQISTHESTQEVKDENNDNERDYGAENVADDEDTDADDKKSAQAHNVLIKQEPAYDSDTDIDTPVENDEDSSKVERTSKSPKIKKSTESQFSPEQLPTTPINRQLRLTQSNDQIREIIQNAESTDEVQAIRNIADLDDLSCGICQKEFTMRANLRRHIDAVHAKIKYPCHLCDSVLTCRESLRHHYNGHMGINQHKCERCERSFPKKSLLQTHLKNCGQYGTKKRGRPRKEQASRIKYIDDDDEEREIKQETELAKVELNDVSFEDNKEDIDVFNGRDPWEVFAEITKQAESSPHIAKVRKEAESGDGYLNCGICGKDYSARSNFVRHIDTVHAQIRYPCNMCNKKISHKEMFKYHFKSHLGELQHKCDTCGMSFAKKGILLTHMKSRRCQKKRKSNALKDKSFENDPYGGDTDTEENVNDLKEENDNKDYSPHKKKKRSSYEENEESFECDLCDKVVTSQILLYKHKHSQHGEPYPFQCDQCGRGFYSSSNLNQHLRMHGNRREFKCSICDKKFNLKQNLKRHTLVVHKQGLKFLCPKCGKVYWDKYELNYHIATHEGNWRYYCKECNKGFMRKPELEQHNTIHHERKRSCLKCNLDFTSKNGFQEHLKAVHNGLNPCHFCDKAFNHALTLRYHINVHEGKYEFLCAICSQRFYSKPQLRRHEREVHNQYQSDFDESKPPRKMYLCHLCGRDMKLPSNLKRHIEYTHNKKRHQCQICNKSYTCPTRLKYHLMEHAGQARFPCTECGRNFALECQYKQHRCYTKNREPTIECPQCNKKFHYSAALSAHQNAVHKERKHLCADCGAAFPGQYSLRRHIESRHKGIKHSCHLCSKSFSQANHLKYHLDEHQGIYRFTCDQCGKGFSMLNNFRSHQQRCGSRSMPPTMPPPPPTMPPPPPMPPPGTLTQLY